MITAPYSRTSELVVAIRDLEKHFPVNEGILQRVKGHVRSVDGVSFEIRRGETLGLVGESGCGKSSLGRCVSGLLEPTGGGVFYDLDHDAAAALETIDDYGPAPKDAVARRFAANHRVGSMTGERRDQFRRSCQVVFQDTHASLNPRLTVRSTVGRAIRLHQDLSGTEITERVVDLLESVGLGSQHLYRYPHQFSGGQRQRISIARALACEPELMILDEPTSSLDVSVQAQILNLLSRLQDEFQLTYLFISHDLNVVRHMSDRLAVMYLGRIVEIGRSDDLFAEPKHPYTEALIAANPNTATAVGARIRLRGAIPSPAEPPQGCRFHTRCPRAFAGCGWEMKDVVSGIGLVDTLAPTMADFSLETPFRGTLTFRDGPSAERAERWLASSAPVGLREAATHVSVVGERLDVVLPEVEPVRLAAAGEHRSSSCLLFTEQVQ